MNYIVVVVVVLSTVSPTGAFAGDGTPLVEAGLDQEVEQGATVLLDGTGSRDPDGTIVAYEWQIETPSGTVEAPRSASDPRTRFVAREAGRYAVTLTVTDDGGKAAKDTLYVDVEGSTATATPTPSPRPAATPTPTAPRSSTPTATRAGATPSIRGPQVVTGERPLRGTYTIVDAGTGVDSIQWTGDGAGRGTGTRTTIDWTAGTHDLEAVVTYRDGTRRIARFADGTTAVEADPKPTVSLANLSGRNAVSGLASTRDEFGNVESVTVSIDGVRTQRRLAGTGEVESLRSDSLAFQFDWYNLELGREFTITATAIDARGQRAETSRTVVPRKAPEIVSARFVNGPVDSYHPRIDAERYTAHHVLTVDLNGVPRDRVEVASTPRNREKTLKLSRRRIEQRSDQLVVHSYWGGKVPSDASGYAVRYVVSAIEENGEQWASPSTRSAFDVEPSPPELRLRMRNDGSSYVGDPNGSGPKTVDFTEPIIIDASASFDPDGSDLRYGWLLGAEPITADNMTARLSSWENGRLVLKDAYGLVSTQRWDSTAGFVPDIVTKEIKPASEAGSLNSSIFISNNEFSPTQTVQIDITTQVARFRRETTDISIGATLDGPSGELVEWREVQHDPERPAAGDQPGGGNAVYYEGTIEIRADALATESLRPALVLYNEARPSHARERTDLPSVTVTDVNGTVDEVTTISDVRYAIRKPVETRVEVDDRTGLNHRRSNGFTVESSRLLTTGYDVEQQVQTQEARYRHRSREFSSSWNRRTFLRYNPNWKAAGVDRSVERTQRSYTHWKSERGTAFTGRTRRVLDEPAEYRTQREYVYTTWETATREVESRQCYSFGCYTFTYEKTVREAVRHTYWADARYHGSHRATGQTRRELVESAQYATEYEHEYVTWDVEVTQTYLVEKTELVQEPRYEWRHYDTVASQRIAYRMASDNPDLRVGDERTKRVWTMVREDSEIVLRPAYENDFDVVETRATVRGNVVWYHTDGSKGELQRDVIDSFEEPFVGEGLMTRDEIREAVTDTDMH